MTKETIKTEWTEKEIAYLKSSNLKILRLLATSKKEYWDSKEIMTELGKETASALAVFARYKTKEDLIIPIRMKKGKRWFLNKKYLPEINNVLERLGPYLD